MTALSKFAPPAFLDVDLVPRVLSPLEEHWQRLNRRARLAGLGPGDSLGQSAAFGAGLPTPPKRPTAGLLFRLHRFPFRNVV